MSSWAVRESDVNLETDNIKLTFSKFDISNPPLRGRKNRSDSLSCSPPSKSTTDRSNCSPEPNYLNLRSRSLSLKRKATSPIKKPCKKVNHVMDQEAIRSLIEQTTESVVSKMRTDMNALEGRIVDQMKNITTPIETAMNAMSVRGDEHEKKIDDLALRIDKLKADITAEIRDDLRNEFFESRNEQMKHALRSEIDRTSTNLILFGFEGGANVEALKGLFETMGVDDCNIVKATKLGLPKGGTKIAPVHITLHNSEQRNNVLKAGGKLPKGVTMERDMPPPYRTCYKKFKKHAWKLRALYDVKTQIVFEAHILTLRYKEEGKSFTIVDEFVPSHYSLQEKPRKPNSSSSAPASSIIPGKGYNDHNNACVFLVPNQPIEDAEHLYKLIGPLLPERSMREIKDCKINKGNVVLSTDSYETASRIVRTLDGQKVDGKKIYAETFGTEE